ncbi:MAG: AAA domain-containing protein, partial [Acidobacteriota bacterium]|nr:AAA domain-containing protein [Acidobacteriota bacterium]
AIGWPKKIMVATPYRAQAKLLREVVEPIDEDKIIAGTVHRMQGGEADLVFFDPVVPDSPFVQTMSVAPRLINVALSRARQQLVVLGAPTEIGKNPFLAPLLDCAERWVPQWELLRGE